MVENSSKDSKYFKWLSSFLLPIAITIASFVVSASIERSKVSSEYVKLATSILSAKLPESPQERQQQVYLKGWAVRVLDRNSPVKMTRQEKKVFENNRLPLANDEVIIADLEKLFNEIRSRNKDGQD